MKIAVLTSGILPVPAVLGGAVENLVDFYLEYNQKNRLYDITVYSVSNKRIEKAHSLYNHYCYIDTNSIWAKIQRKIYQYSHISHYYNYHIDFFFHKTLKHIAKEKYDIIILENRPGYAIPISQISDAKIILHLHNDLLNSEVKQAQEIYNTCHQIITVSDFIKQRVNTIGLPSKSTTVYNGIDISIFQQPTCVLKRNDLGFQDNDFIIVYSGRINKEKGVKELLEAMCLLKKNPDIKLLLLGSVSLGLSCNNDQYLYQIQTIAQELGNKIEVTGFVPYSLIPSYLKLCDIAVVPSLWDDPFPTTILEAMAAGLPIITTLSGGIPEACNECAIILNRDNIQNQLANQIMYLYTHPEIRIKMRKAGQQKSLIFNKDRYAQDFFQEISQ